MMVILSTFGSTNGNILATARVSFAVAQDQPVLKRIGEIHPRFKTPGNALWVHGIWTSVLVFSGSFDMLTDMLIFVSWIFYGLSALGIFILRSKMKEAERPYKVWGYPLVPGIFLAFTILFLSVTLFNDIMSYAQGTTPLVNSAFGLSLTGLGIPVYWYLQKAQTRINKIP
jgi:APA family basic amino acid/polyamine antiporter